MYQLQHPPLGSTQSFAVIRANADGSITSIPFDSNNIDYQSYLAWVAAGNTAAPAS